MKKKLTALLAVFLVTLSVLPMRAAAVTKPSTRISGVCAVPNITIEVTVPTSTNAYLNPKKVSVSLGSTLAEGQIISEPAYIENKSEVPIAVSASVTGAVNRKSSLTLSHTSTTGMSDKEAFVYFEMQAVKDPKDVTWSTSYNAEKHLIVTEDGDEKEDFVTIGAATQDDHFGAFQLTGDCVTDPVDDPWTSKDSFTAKIVFTFKALPLT
jgi:hypothetical protein